MFLEFFSFCPLSQRRKPEKEKKSGKNLLFSGCDSLPEFNRCVKMDVEIKQMLETSFLDWDGKIVAVLYVPDCNFRCPFCHNWKLFEEPEEYETVPFEKIEKYLTGRGYKDFIDGVCVTGGEPTLYSGLPKFLKKIKALKMLVKLDTNGSNPEMLASLIEEKLVDYVAMDIKAPFDERYDEASGVKVDMDNIRESIRILMKSGIEYEFRTTIVPTLLDDIGFEEMMKELEGAEKYVLQQFVSKNCYSERFREIKPYGREEFNHMVMIGGTFVNNLVVRGNID